MTTQIDTLQKLLNETASAPNYQLESKTISTFDLIHGLYDLHQKNDSGGNSTKRLFDAWIEWLADWDNYSRNLLHRRRLIGILNKGLGEGRYSFQIYPYASLLYTIGPVSGIMTVHLHEGLDFMQENVCNKFASMIVSRKNKGIRDLVRDYMDAHPECRQLIDHFNECRGHRTPKDDTKGRYYDLETVFENCSQRHFKGRMPRPKVLHWSAHVNHKTMGSYNPKDDSLMVNCGLDRADVPAYVLDFIMYHELLHKALGIKTSGGRRMAHTAEFRKYEKGHPDYERAQTFLQKLVSKL